MRSPYRAWKSLSSKRWYGTSAILLMIRPLTCWADSASKRLVAASVTIRRTVSSASRLNRTPSSTIPRGRRFSGSVSARTRSKPRHTTSSMSGNATDSSTLAVVPMMKADRSTWYSSFSVLPRCRSSRPMGWLQTGQRDFGIRLGRGAVLPRQEVRHAGDQRQAELFFQPQPLPVGIEVEEHELPCGSHDHVDRCEVDLEAAHQAVEPRLHALGEVEDLVPRLFLLESAGAPVHPRALAGLRVELGGEYLFSHDDASQLVG